MTEYEMVRWHHQLNGLKFEQALEVGDGQGGLVCYSPWGFKEQDMTEQLNWITSYYRAYRLVENVDINQIFTEINKRSKLVKGKA